MRAFVCTAPNPWNYPAKDRAGRLEQIEKPHLGELIAKLIGPGERKPFAVAPLSTPEQTTLKRERRLAMAYDYSDAPEQRGIDLIPDGTVATVQLDHSPRRRRRGRACSSAARTARCEMLDLEFVVVDGPQAKRKLWERMVINGTTDGHAKAAEISRGRLRAIIEFARGIKPSDMSAEARKARTVELGDFDGLRFIAKIGIEKGKPEERRQRRELRRTAT